MGLTTFGPISVSPYAQVFEAAAIHLGALGVVTEMELEVVPAFSVFKVSLIDHTFCAMTVSSQARETKGVTPPSRLAHTPAHAPPAFGTSPGPAPADRARVRPRPDVVGPLHRHGAAPRVQPHNVRGGAAAAAAVHRWEHSGRVFLLLVVGARRQIPAPASPLAGEAAGPCIVLREAFSV